MQLITSYNTHHNTSQENQSDNSYRQFTKHLASNKHMPTFTYFKVHQMQREHFKINSCNNNSRIPYGCSRKGTLKYPLVKKKKINSSKQKPPLWTKIFGFKQNTCYPKPHNPLTFHYSPNPPSIYHKYHKIAKPKEFNRRYWEKTLIFTLGFMHFNQNQNINQNQN